jgi:hypothetical protein
MIRTLLRAAVEWRLGFEDLDGRRPKLEADAERLHREYEDAVTTEATSPRA